MSYQGQWRKRAEIKQPSTGTVLMAAAKRGQQTPPPTTLEPIVKGRKRLLWGPHISATIEAYCPLSGVQLKNLGSSIMTQRFTTTVTQDSTDSLSHTLESQTDNSESKGNSRREFVLPFSGFLRMPACSALGLSSCISKAHAAPSSQLSSCSHCLVFSVSLTVASSLHVSVLLA